MRSPGPLLRAITLRVPAAEPPIRFPVAWAPNTWMPPLAFPCTVGLPEVSRPIQQSSTVLSAESRRIPHPTKRLITRLRTSDPELPAEKVRPVVGKPAPAPLSWTRVAPPVLPWMDTTPVTRGSADAGAIVGVPAPSAKVMVSAPADAFASWSAARSVHAPVPSSQTPSPADASLVSAVELTTKVAVVADGTTVTAPSRCVDRDQVVESIRIEWQDGDLPAALQETGAAREPWVGGEEPLLVDEERLLRGRVGRDDGAVAPHVQAALGVQDRQLALVSQRQERRRLALQREGGRHRLGDARVRRVQPAIAARHEDQLPPQAAAKSARWLPSNRPAASAVAGAGSAIRSGTAVRGPCAPSKTRSAGPCASTTAATQSRSPSRRLTSPAISAVSSPESSVTEACPKPPSPSPRSVVNVALPRSASTRSAVPSPSKSPAAIRFAGKPRAATFRSARKPPASGSVARTWISPSYRTARSSRPSRSKSATAVCRG